MPVARCSRLDFFRKKSESAYALRAIQKAKKEPVKTSAIVHEREPA